MGHDTAALTTHTVHLVGSGQLTVEVKDHALDGVLDDRLALLVEQGDIGDAVRIVLSLQVLDQQASFQPAAVFHISKGVWNGRLRSSRVVLTDLLACLLAVGLFGAGIASHEHEAQACDQRDNGDQPLGDLDIHVVLFSVRSG